MLLFTGIPIQTSNNLGTQTLLMDLDILTGILAPYLSNITITLATDFHGKKELLTQAHLKTALSVFFGPGHGSYNLVFNQKIS